MKNFFYISFLLIGSVLFAQKTESPYLKVLTKDAIIPLQSTKADVSIVGKIAHVTITQTYHNLGAKAIEAQYVFPMSIHAAVHDMKMKVGNRAISAVVYEKKQAKKVYNKALKAGKRASKLEQHRPNVFSMNVGNIMPKDLITIEISYTEMLTPKEGDYQFVFPGVVGPRFTGEAKANNPVLATAHSPKGTKASFDYEINVTIAAGLILQKVNSTSHTIRVNYPDATTAEIDMVDADNPANRDFVLNYSMRGKEIQGGLLLYQGEKENFFSFMVEPPKTTNPTQIPPREYMFVVDVSGSMMGYPIEVAKSLMKNLLSNLRAQDAFNVLLFSADNKVFHKEAVRATDGNIKLAFQFLNGKFNNYGGGTRLLRALEAAYAMPKKHASTSRTMVVITDGYVAVEREAFELIGNNLDKANVTTFGIGSSVNRFLIEGMSRVGQSTSFIATNKTEAYQVAAKFRDYIASPMLTQVKLESNGFDMYDMHPKSVPDVFAQRPLMVYGKFKGNPTGTLTVSGYLGTRKVSKTYLVKNGRLSKSHKALKYLWARTKIQELDDYYKAFGNQGALKKQITDLGIAYNLATKYTSFVAVDTEVVNQNGKNKKVNQVLPLPKNVANSAVGAAAEIKGTSIYKKEYTISVREKIAQSQVRALKIWLKGSKSQLIKTWLLQGRHLRIVADKMGRIVTIEIDVNGKWTKLSALKSGLYQLPDHIKLTQQITIDIAYRTKTSK